MNRTKRSALQAIKKPCERVCEVFEDDEYSSLSTVSVSYLYNARSSASYSRQRRHFKKTKYKPSAIAERRKPQPNSKRSFCDAFPLASLHG
jgi:hypothetical protein